MQPSIKEKSDTGGVTLLAKPHTALVSHPCVALSSV